MEARVHRKGQTFFNVLKEATPVNENDLFGDLEPEIYEEELYEIVVYGD